MERFKIVAVLLVLIASASGLDCGTGQFACSDGSECIRESFRCDGYHDCTDRSDDTTLVCGQNCSSVSDGGFACADGIQCIQKWVKCNGDPHCQDGSDETTLTCGQIYSVDIGDAPRSATKTFVVTCEGRCKDITATIKVDTGDPDLFATEHQPPQIGGEKL